METSYDFVVALHKRGGKIVEQIVVRGGIHFEYLEPNETEVRVTFYPKKKTT